MGSHPASPTPIPLASLFMDRYLMTFGTVSFPPMILIRTSVWLQFTLNPPSVLYLRIVSRRLFATLTRGVPSRAWSWTYMSLTSP